MEEASSLARPFVVEEVRVGPLGPLCTERGQQVACWLCAQGRGCVLRSVEMFILCRPPGLPGVRDPSGGRVIGRIAFSMGSFAGFSPPSDPLPQPLGMPWLVALECPKTSSPKPVCFSCPGDAGGMCTCWPLRERRRAHPLFSQGALPKGGKAASVDRINLAYRTKNSHDIQFPPIN